MEAGEAKHIFSHKEWHMIGYNIRVDELSKAEETAKSLGMIFADKTEIEEKYPLPSAYAAYARYLHIKQGADAVKNRENKNSTE